MNYQEYIDVLFDEKKKNKGLNEKNCFDDKRQILDNYINSLSYFHKNRKSQ